MSLSMTVLGAVNVAALARNFDDSHFLATLPTFIQVSLTKQTY